MGFSIMGFNVMLIRRNDFQRNGSTRIASIKDIATLQCGGVADYTTTVINPLLMTSNQVAMHLFWICLPLPDLDIRYGLNVNQGRGKYHGRPGSGFQDFSVPKKYQVLRCSSQNNIQLMKNAFFPGRKDCFAHFLPLQ